jgi:hypothetical protein
MSSTTILVVMCALVCLGNISIGLGLALVAARGFLSRGGPKGPACLLLLAGLVMALTGGLGLDIIRVDYAESLSMERALRE